MQKIRIENFGPINKAEIEIKQLVVFIGEQASGKSTISKLVYFFKSLKEDLFTLIFNNIGTNEDIRLLFIKEIQLKFYRFFGSTRHLQHFKIKFFYSSQKTIELTLNSSKFLNVEFDYDFYGAIGHEVFALLNVIKKPSLVKNTYELIAIEQSKNKYLKQLKSIVDKLFEDEKPSLFVPAGRNITVTYKDQFKLDFFGNLSLESEKERKDSDRNQSADTYLMLEFLRKIESIKETFKENDFESLINTELNFENISKEYSKILQVASDIINKILKGKYVYDRYGEKIFFDSKNSRYVHLNNASSGQQEVIRILQDCFLILLNKEDVFRVIEEPEAHLYPLAQKNLIELLAMIINNTNSQIIITTHSPYILSVINNLIFAQSVRSLIEEHSNEEFDTIKFQENSLIEPSKFQAYGLHVNENGGFKSIFDTKTQLIGENYLDEISQIVGSEFNEMFEVYKQLKPHKRARK